VEAWRVAKVGPAMRLTELEAKSKVMFRCKIFERESCYLGVLNKIYLQNFFHGWVELARGI